MSQVSNDHNQQKTAGDELADQLQMFDSLMNELAALLSNDNNQSASPANTPPSHDLAKPARTIPRNIQQFPRFENPPQMMRTEKAPVA